MKAAMLTSLRQMELNDVQEPSLKKETDVLLRIEKVGICGSDVMYTTTRPAESARKLSSIPS